MCARSPTSSCISTCAGWRTFLRTWASARATAWPSTCRWFRRRDRHAGLRPVGAIHTVIFGGFQSEAIKDRINDCKAKLVITADGGWRRGKVIELKANVDKAVDGTPTVQTVMVLKRCGNPVTMTEGRDVWWKDAWPRRPNTHKAKAFDSEHPLFILYTSGSTGKPKGVLHTSAGYLLGATEFELRLRSQGNDRYFCTADVGWITGHSYVVYGLLANGATGLHVRGRAQSARSPTASGR
jgi:acetyl-CoA synthetase